MNEAERVAAGLTKAQSWAMLMIQKGNGVSPATLGGAMMDRPGATKGRTVQYKAQGYGRMGGGMMSRLKAKGLVNLSWGSGANWHPTTATLTPLGQSVATILKEQEREG